VQLLQLPLGQSFEVSQGRRWFEPKLRFAVWGQDMNVDSLFFPRKEEEPVGTLPKNFRSLHAESSWVKFPGKRCVSILLERIATA